LNIEVVTMHFCGFLFCGSTRPPRLSPPQADDGGRVFDILAYPFDSGGGDDAIKPVLLPAR